MKKQYTLMQLHGLARAMPYGQFEQEIKSNLTGMPYTAVIDVDTVLIIKNK